MKDNPKLDAAAAQFFGELNRTKAQEQLATLIADVQRLTAYRAEIDDALIELSTQRQSITLEWARVGARAEVERRDKMLIEAYAALGRAVMTILSD